MSRSLLPPIAFGTCGLIWGSTFLAIRIGNVEMPALWACSLRLAIAGLMLAALMFVTKQTWPKGAGLTAACWYGLLEFGIGLPLLYWGEKVVPSGLAAVLYAICPIAAMIGAKALGLENWTLTKLAAGVISFLGVGIIFWREVLDGASPAGILAILVAAAAAAMAGLMLQRGPRQGALGVNTVGAIVGFLPSIASSFLMRESHAFPTNFGQFFPILYLAVMSSGVAFGLFAWLINHWKATSVSFLGVIVPVIAVCVGAIFYKEKIAPEALLGALVVIVGVVTALRSEATIRATPALMEP